ncbi:MAG: 50S ribosomal protein L6 [Mycoplasmataceae bacterium]|jgi:large subunit ribosomal protein L6|nr:50S ribosomal protein L6 [Mycoplasmataceae bacterium]
MSRKGNKLLTIPQGVTVTINSSDVLVKSAQGTLKVAYPTSMIKVENVDNKIKISRLNDEKQARMFHGTINSNINNALIGLSKGYVKKLKIVGVGFKANVSGAKLNLAIGFSHPVVFDIPQGLKVICPTPTEIVIEGYDKIIVGEFAANVRAVRKPEPYNGKGIMYSDEIIVRKVGKTAEGAGTTAGGAAKK